MSSDMPKEIWACHTIGSAHGVTGKLSAGTSKVFDSDTKYIRADIASQKQPETRSEDVCFSESGDNALEALENIEDVCQNLTGVLKNCKTIRTALQQAQRAQEIVDLMEQGKDIAFVSENHGEFIYRTQHSLSTQQDRAAVRDLSNHPMEKWIAASLDDQHVCDEMKRDVKAWFDTLDKHAETIKRAGGE